MLFCENLHTYNISNNAEKNQNNIRIVTYHDPGRTSSSFLHTGFDEILYILLLYLIIQFSHW